MQLCQLLNLKVAVVKIVLNVKLRMTNNEIARINGYIEDLNVNIAKLASDAYEANLEVLMDLNQNILKKPENIKSWL